MLDLPELGSHLAARHTRDLFRLETLPYYHAASDDEDYRRYLDGAREPSAAAKKPWLERLRGDTAAGRRWRRVHVLRQPLSDYLRYECEWGYTFNTEAGEDVRVVDLSLAPPGAEILADIGDFFVIDDQHAVRMQYTDHGRFEGAAPVDESLVAAYRTLAETAWLIGVPFTTWWAEHPQYHRSKRPKRVHGTAG